MELRKIASRKAIKLLTLLLTAMLIASASAAVYYSMIMQPSVTVSQPPVIFVQGSDFNTTVGSGWSIGTNSTWVSLALKAYPNATLTYEQPLNVSNIDSTNHTFRLRNISITPASGSQVGNFTFINFTVLNTAGVSQASFNYTQSSNTWDIPSPTSYSSCNMPANTQWVIYIQTQAAAGANSGVVANIQIAVDVQ